MEDKLFYVAQKGIINNGDKVLILFKDDGRIDFPGGKIQEGADDVKDSFAREIMEETGLKVDIGKPFYTWTFTLPERHKNAGRTVFMIGYGCNYIDGDIKISDEHVGYEWIDESDLHRFTENNGEFFIALQEYFSNK